MSHKEVYEIDLRPVFIWLRRNIYYIILIIILSIIGNLFYLSTKPTLTHTISYITAPTLSIIQTDTTKTRIYTKYLVHPKTVVDYININQPRICQNQCEINAILIQKGKYPVKIEIIGKNPTILIQKHNEIVELLNQLPVITYYQEKYLDNYKHMLNSKKQLLQKYKTHANVVIALQNETELYERALKDLQNLHFWFMMPPQITQN